MASNYAVEEVGEEIAVPLPSTPKRSNKEINSNFSSPSSGYQSGDTVDEDEDPSRKEKEVPPRKLLYSKLEITLSKTDIGKHFRRPCPRPKKLKNIPPEAFLPPLPVEEVKSKPRVERKRTVKPVEFQEHFPIKDSKQEDERTKNTIFEKLDRTEENALEDLMYKKKEYSDPHTMYNEIFSYRNYAKQDWVTRSDPNHWLERDQKEEKNGLVAVADTADEIKAQSVKELTAPPPTDSDLGAEAKGEVVDKVMDSVDIGFPIETKLEPVDSGNDESTKLESGILESAVDSQPKLVEIDSTEMVDKPQRLMRPLSRRSTPERSGINIFAIFSTVVSLGAVITFAFFRNN